MPLDLGTPPAPSLNMGGTCAVGAYISDHPDDADQLRAAITNQAWTLTHLAAALREQGVPIGYQALVRHRKGACKCVERGLA